MLVNFTGRHRLTPKTRAVRAWTRVRISDVTVVAFWGALVAAAGVGTGFVWGWLVS